MPLVRGKADEMVQLIHNELREASDPQRAIELRDFIRRTMWDIFGLTVLGHDFQTLGKPSNRRKGQILGCPPQPQRFSH